ncbi:MULTISPECIES: arsenate reductase/protein-tyrosine-phosphatase family protein [Enterobacter]|uniref:arsenate reductase/protein-tyrosine-phosphatase family protein n=1 Tax=Enterobacter TaxID=547 RepID=UPI000AE8F71B|nr:MULTISPECIES: protein tyrosine phosphatase [Enterobacter]VAL43357.1 Low molecular weight protein-tyrosine-phosphatase etp [Enterobacter kobei]
MMFRNIMVICTGNICRSPAGERLLQRLLPGRRIDSAGIPGLSDHPADSMMRAVCEARGLSLEGHLSRPVTPAMLRRYELLLVMEQSHLRRLTALAPECRGKTLLFSHWSEHAGQRNIRDPFGQHRQVYEQVFHQLERAALAWVQHLTERP